MRNCHPRLAALALLVAAPAFAADHADGPAVTANKDADLADLFAWMEGSAKVNLAMTWFPDAPATSKPSDAVHFVFNVISKQTFDDPTPETTRIICGFDAAQKIQCWVGAAEYVAGDASTTAGLTSASGKLKVFAGRRNDPFFFNQAGFKATVAAVKSAAPGLQFDPAGCPILDQPTSDTLVTQLKTSPDGGTAQDAFKGQAIQAIVVQVDKSLLTTGGPILGVYASTHQK